MKNFSIIRLLVSIILFVILYFLSGTIIFYLLSGHIEFFNFGSEMLFGPISYIPLIKYFFVADLTNSGWGGVGAALGLGVLIGLVVLFFISYYISGKIIRSTNKETQI